MLTSQVLRDLVMRSAARILTGHSVVRVADEPTLDALGEPAVDIIIVFAKDDEGPTGDAILDAMGDISRELYEAGEGRTLIVSFANEGELTDHAYP